MTFKTGIPYSEVERQWLSDNRTLPRKELHERFVELFGRDDVSLVNIIDKCKREGWLTGRTGRFDEKGNTNRTDNRLPIGTIRDGHDGYLRVKVSNGLPDRYKCWPMLHIVNWEKENGPVPDGHLLVCRDGNKKNADPSNWVALSRRALPRANGMNGNLPLAEAPDELKPAIEAIAKLEGHILEKASG